MISKSQNSLVDCEMQINEISLIGEGRTRAQQTSAEVRHATHLYCPNITGVRALQFSIPDVRTL